MAKPIRSTPELKGEEAEKFVKKMIVIEKSPIKKIDEDLAEEVRFNSKFFIVL